MKKTFSYILIVSLIFMSKSCLAIATGSNTVDDKTNLFTEVSYQVGNSEFTKNGSKSIIDSSNKSVVPFLKQNRVMIPLRSVAESFGLSQIEYEEATSTVNILGNPSLKIKADCNEIAVSKFNIDNWSLEDTTFTSDTAPIIVNDRIFVPLRMISELFGYRVEWNDNSQIVFISNKPDTYKDTSLLDLETVTVSNAKEFLKALSSNKHIILKQGLYNLTSEDSEESANGAWHWEDPFDGKELILDGVSNLIIEGAGQDKTEIVVEPRYANVLTFRSCNNIIIKNIKAGHTKEQGECRGGVMRLESSSNIIIDNSILYGCGTEGISGRGVNGLSVANSVIEDCSVGIISFTEFKNCLLKNSVFRNTDGYSMFDILASNNIIFDDCDISNNKSDSKYSDFFEVYYSNGVKFINCNIKNNTGRQSGKVINNIDFTGTVIESNEFDEAFKLDKFKDAYITDEDFIIEGLKWQMPKSDIISLLGEPDSINDNPNEKYYFRANSIMVYDKFNIGLNTKDELIRISITSPGIKTNRGIEIGSTKHDVLSKYGYPGNEFNKQMTYGKDNLVSPYPYLYFDIENDVVVSMGINTGAY